MALLATNKRRYTLSVKSNIESFMSGFLSANISKWNRLFLLEISAKIRLRQRKLLRLDIHLADHCNLNCKGCEHLSPLAEEKFLAIETFERDCKRITALTGGHIEEISLLGGEPLLHPRIIDIIEIARKYFPVGRIQIATNGILLLKQSELFWETLNKNNIRLNITVYPIKIDHTEIYRLSKKHKVEIVYWGNLKQMKKVWEKMPIDIQGKQDSQKSFKLCYAANHCFQLVDGKIYPCFRVAYIHYFNKKFGINLEVGENDYIDLYKAQTIEKILKFLCKAVPFCRYCNMERAVYKEWAVSKKEIDEWTE
ncbi:MAG: radical SAM protein [Treponema sp.]|nr:radical SAM protein [Treponema sp.]